MKGFITNHKLLSGASIVGLILIWHSAAWLLNEPLILPSPGVALLNLLILSGTRDFWQHIGTTLGRGLIAFGLSFFIAIVIGIAAGKSKSMDVLLRPFLVCLRSTPSMSFIILALLWFRGGNVSLFVITLAVLPVLIQNIIEGTRSIDPELREMAILYQVKKSRLLWKLYLPSMLPFLAAGVSSGLGLTWKVSIAAEVLAYPTWGMGTQMDTARIYLQTEKVFAWTLAVITIGLIFDYLAEYLLRRPFAVWKGTKDV
jgi:NitT/TauT family transport system permease protein